MRSRKQTPPELNGDHIDDSAKEPDSAAVDALALAEEAEAEAAEAEAAADAARARAKALRLRREAEEAKAAETIAAPEAESDESDDQEFSIPDGWHGGSDAPQDHQRRIWRGPHV